MTILIKIAQLLLSLSILVILHELGHFTFAKLFKTRVEKFYLFFDPWFSLFKLKKGETEYGVGWLPLGGYVKISGMIDESMDLEQMKQPPQSWEFRSKPAYQRLLIMLGGVLVNFIFALLVYSAVLWVWGEKYLPTKNATYGIMCDSLAMKTGFQNGDKIISLDNVEVENFAKLTTSIVLNNPKNIKVLRNDSLINIHVSEEYIAAIIREKKGFLVPRIPFYVDDFAKESAAREAGVKKGDRIIGLNNDSITFFDQFKTSIAKHKGEKVEIKLLRNDSIVKLPLQVSQEGLIGVSADFNLEKHFKLKTIEYSFFASFPAGISRGFEMIGNYLKQFRLIFSSKTQGYKEVGGFIAMGKIFPDVWDWEAFWNLTAFLSIILAVMNLLPIPALDGGHVAFLMYEIVTRRKPSDKFLEYAQYVGLCIVLLLLIYANGNDIIRLVKDLF